jgi:oxygen-dependent protoporphyrinogen oxidase
MREFETAVVGGGIAGLSTAWYLQAGGARSDYVLFEQASRCGGHIFTERVSDAAGNAFVVEGGPDSFITQKPAGLQLARELGVQDRLLGTNDRYRKVFVAQRGKVTPLPDGVLLIVPTKFAPFALSPLISPWGKLRMGLDLFIPPRRDDGDETLADFVRRRLGGEALDKIAEPLLSGIYNSEAERQSLLATFPRFRALEAEHGSLTRGMLRARRNSVPPASKNGHGSGGAPTSKPLSLFVTLRGGMGELVDALVAQLRGDLRPGCGIRRLARMADGRYALATTAGDTIAARKVVLATPAFVTSRLLSELVPAAGPLLGRIRYVSTGTISLAYRRADLGRAPRGFGLVVPRSERRPINAVTWSSLKFDGRAPEGYELLRVFFGGSRSPASMALDDDALLAAVRRELQQWMGIDAPPRLYRIHRRVDSNAQYDVGHLDRVRELEALLPPNLFVTGSPFRGVGIPDCVSQARETAAKASGNP